MPYILQHSVLPIDWPEGTQDEGILSLVVDAVFVVVFVNDPTLPGHRSSTQ